MSEIEPTEPQGDPACRLHRVCPECGALADEERPTVCLRCGATEFGA
jgi:ribosomal protein S27AE